MCSNFKTKDRMRNVLRILARAIIALVLFQNCQKSDFTIVTGIVKDSLTNKPIEGAVIFIDYKKPVTTASDGTFTIEGIKSGKTVFSIINVDGYKHTNKSVIVSGGRVNKINLVLTPFANPFIETGKVTKTSFTTASITGSLIFSIDVNSIQVGHCWSNSTSFPTLEASDGHTSLGASSTFTSNLTGLNTDNIYFVRAYTITTTGSVIYGNTIAFRTLQVFLENGLIVNCPFNGTYTNESGQGNATLWTDFFPNWPPFVMDRFGNTNSACLFSNTDLYGYKLPGFNDLAVSLWFYKSNVWENSEQVLFLIGEWSQNRFYIAQGASPNNFYCIIRVNSVNYSLALNSYPTLNAWHNVIAQRKGTNLYLYIDGTLEGSINCPSNFLPPVSYYDIGAGWLTTGCKNFNGIVDDVKVYNRALTDSEIQYLKTN